MRLTARLPSRDFWMYGFLAVAVTVPILPAVVCPAADPAASKAGITRGVEYLLQTQSRDGSWNTWGHELGETALAGMALLAGGQAVESQGVMAAAQVVRRLAKSDTSTYDTSLAIMFLDRLGQPIDAELLRELGGRLRGGQCRDGSWSYDLPRSSAGYGTGPGEFGGRGDNSNTQFAALAAWVSRRHGVDNDPALRLLDQYFRRGFNQSAGGWPYIGGGSGATPTMTCAGLVGLATHRGAEQQRLAAEASRSRPTGPDAPRPGRLGGAAANDPVAKRALEALGQELKLADRNLSAGINTDLYFFWSLERVGVIYDIREIGGVDWYRWGSERLLKGQSPDGQWKGTGSKGWEFEKNVGTSFAILFLSRANVAADLTAQVGSGGGVGAPPPGLGGGSQLLRRGGDDPPPPPAQTPPPARRPRVTPEKKPQVGPAVLDPF
jgi:hypothetical protein